MLKHIFILFTGLSQNFVMGDDAASVNNSSFTSFIPGIVPCVLVKNNTVNLNETLTSGDPNPVPSPADQRDRWSLTGKQTEDIQLPHYYINPNKSSFASRSPGRVPYALVRGQTVTSSETSDAISNPVSSQSDNWSAREKDDISIDHRVPHHYTTPPIWPTSNNNRDDSSQGTLTSCDHSYGMVAGTSQVTQDSNPPKKVGSILTL